MNQFRTILFPTDFSRCSDQAYAWAASIAVDYGARIHALHVTFLLRGAATEHAFAASDGEREEITDNRMRALLESRPKSPPRVQGSTRRALSVAPEILSYSDEEDIDLIVMGTQGRRGIGYLALGSVAEEVVRNALCPVLTVREQEHARPIEEMKTILLPFDGSEHSAVALSFARELAARFGASLQLLHVVHTPVYPSFYALDEGSFRAKLGDVHASARERLRSAMAETEGPRIPFETFVVDGAPAAAILDFVEHRGCGLVVLPKHGVTSLRRFFLGSVAEKVVRRCSVPVMTLPVLEVNRDLNSKEPHANRDRLQP